MRLSLLVAAMGLLFAAGCVETEFPPMLMCGEGGECPPGQVCVPKGGPGVCSDPLHLPPADAAPDALPDAVIMPDAIEIDAPVPDVGVPDVAVDAPVDAPVTSIDAVPTPDMSGPTPDTRVIDAPPPDASVPDVRPPDAAPPDAPLPAPDAPPPPPDAMPVPDVAGVCDPVLQNCVPSSDACYWRSPANGGTECAAAGTSTAHMPCGTDSQCAKGFGCTMNPQGMECMPYCDATHATCGAPEHCVTLDSRFGICQTYACDPAAQDAPCACYYDPMHMVGLCGPMPETGAGSQGAACTPSSAIPPEAPCEPDYDCTACAGGSHACSQYCDDAHPCAGAAAGLTCVPFGGTFESALHFGSCKPSGCN